MVHAQGGPSQTAHFIVLHVPVEKIQIDTIRHLNIVVLYHFMSFVAVLNTGKRAL